MTIKDELLAVADGQGGKQVREDIAKVIASEHLTSGETRALASGLGHENFSDERLERAAREILNMRSDAERNADSAAEYRASAAEHLEHGDLKPSTTPGGQGGHERGGR